MNKFDRELQRYILSCCVEAYPAHTKWGDFSPESISIDGIKLSANIIYLMDHGLLTIREKRSDDPYSFLDNMRATHKGIDFLQNDGGLSAILNIQTVKLHSETIVALEDLIALSSLPESERASVVSKLRELPASAITHLMNELISKAVVAAPAALQIIQKYLQGG